MERTYFLLTFVVLMRTEKVIVRDPQGQVIAGIVDVVKTVCMARGIDLQIKLINQQFIIKVLNGVE